MSRPPASGRGLWPFAQAVYAAPGVETACLRLQDEAGQCVALLLFCLWCARTGRRLDADALAGASALSRGWEAGVATPLRTARRSLRGPLPGIDEAGRLALRARAAALSLAGERLLLESLEVLAPAATGADIPAGAALAAIAAHWGGPVLAANATDALATLAAAEPQALPQAAEVLHIGGESGRGQRPMHNDDPPTGDDPPELGARGDSGEGSAAEDEAAVRSKLRELRQAHQDLDAAVAALEAGAQPDQLRIARLKKRKLVLRDQIAKLDNRLTPDIIA